MAYGIFTNYLEKILLTFDSDKQLLKFADCMNHHHASIKFTFKAEKKLTFHFRRYDLQREQQIYQLFSGNLPLAVYLVTLIVSFLYRTNMV